MSARRYLYYGAAGAVLALPSLALLALTAAGLVLSVVVVGAPLLIGGLVLLGAVARLDRWIARRLVGAAVEEPGSGAGGPPWRSAGLTRATREAAFVLARSAIGLGVLAWCAVAATACVAGIGAVTVDGFLAQGQWRSTAGLGSWWGPLLAAAALATALAALAAGGLLQSALVGLLGPTESARVEEAERERAAAEQRARLAADLHDAVGHALTVTTLQAAAAARVVRTDPDFAVAALLRIETDSRRALDEVDRALALLAGGACAPAPDSRQLPELLAALRLAGLEVDEDIELPEILPAQLSEAVYRIVQEAGTNALRHGTEDDLRVSITSDRHTLALRIVNRGIDTAARSTLGPAGGHGLEGLRARCTALGGSLTAGPSADGAGWTVAASLPLPGTTA